MRASQGWSSKRSLVTASILASTGLAACGDDAGVVGGDCEQGKVCEASSPRSSDENAGVIDEDCEQGEDCEAPSLPPTIDSVDILLVVDNSKSIEPAAAQIKAELPRLINAIVTGHDGDTSFPAASSVHVGVTTSSVGPLDIDLAECLGQGGGEFLKPAEVGVTCDVSYPGFLAFEQGSATLATVDTVSCVPLVPPGGCGFEQPLEAGLRAVSPAIDHRTAFINGSGVGDTTNAGFLREDSLLVVVVVTDEDDCSIEGGSRFFHDPNALGENVRCALSATSLYDVNRYVEGFRGLRQGNDNVIFAVIGGVPAYFVSEEVTADFDLASDEGAAAYFARVQSDPRMTPVADGDPYDPSTLIKPACKQNGLTATPPVRLLEMAAAFGPRGVLGSVCADDYGHTTGRLIRAIGQRMTEAAESAVH